jgi:ADP-ribosyl-[dinitrogen reductase] hydrolase
LVLNCTNIKEKVAVLIRLPSDIARAGLLGLLVGDAVGVPYEFNHPSDLPALEAIDMVPPAGFHRSHRRTPVGTWSDDGAHSLALLDSLTKHPDLDLEDLASRLSSWQTDGKYTPDGVVFDIGHQTAVALSRWRQGTPAATCGGTAVTDNGNGALMRSLACLLAPSKDLSMLLDRALRHGLPTHGHAQSRVTCALYVMIGWHIGVQGVQHLEQALSDARISLGFALPTELQPTLEFIMEARHETPRGSGYVVDSFWSAWHALVHSNSYESCIKQAIKLGKDTDTTACIAGGLAGLLYGESKQPGDAGIPQRWIDQLQGRELALSLLPQG